MPYKRFQALAQIVGSITLALLALYGLLSLLNGGTALASVAAMLNPDSSRSVAETTSVVPSTFNYQGFLRDSTGNLVTGSYTITAKIYSTATLGSALYEETFYAVTVRDGLFNVVLGDDPGSYDLKTVFDEMPRYIGITLEPDEELIPRQRVHGVPWALYATNASYAMTSTTLVPDATVSGLTVNGNMTADGLTVNGNMTADGITASDLNVNGNISATGLTLTPKPFIFTKFDGNPNTNWNEIDTGVPTNTHTCAVAGFHTGWMDIWENTSGDFLYVMPVAHADNWYIHTHVIAHLDLADWTVWVMCVANDFASLENGYGE